MKRKSFVRTALVASNALLALPLARCTDAPVVAPTPEPQVQAALFTDADVDRAVLERPTRTVQVFAPDNETPSVATVAPGSRAANRTADSSPGVYLLPYIEQGPLGVDLNLLELRANVSADPETIYAGNREIQSVAVREDGRMFIISMRRTTNPRSNFEIYRFNRETGALSRLTDTPYDETNVSMSANGRKIVWEDESPAGRRAVFIRERGTESVLAHRFDQVEPSVSGDGNFIALVRKPAHGEYIGILSYSVSSGPLYNWVARSSSYELAHPSVSNNGEKVAYIERQPTRDRVRLENMLDGTTTTVAALRKNDLAADGIGHAFLVSRGDLSVHEVATDPRSRIVVKDLLTGSSTTVAAVSGGVKLRGGVAAYLNAAHPN